jgi:uncharacterized membrane protein
MILDRSIPSGPVHSGHGRSAGRISSGNLGRALAGLGRRKNGLEVEEVAQAVPEVASSKNARVDLDVVDAREEMIEAKVQVLILATFLKISGTAVALCAAGIALFLIGALAAKDEIAEARGLDKIAALTSVCFAIPLAVFGALHLFGPQFVIGAVPRYMPWRSFWVYFVGCALIAASLSIATKTAVRWSGLLFGIMMFLFVAMIHLRGALAQPHDRIIWTIVFREMSFGGAGWILAGTAVDGWRGRGRSALITVGRLLIAMAAILFGVEHFLHPTGLPGVPLQKQMPTWIPARALIDYVTGAALLVAGGSILLARKTDTVAACLGGWILLLVLVIYGPVLIVALSEPGTAVQVEGINYFADTLLFAGTILTVASATSRPRIDV